MKLIRLEKHHNRKAFDCGDSEINGFLMAQARQAAKKSYSKTYVLIGDDQPDRIMAFYTIAICRLEKPLHHVINTAYPHPLFGVKLARMGVDVAFQGQGPSPLLIVDAIAKTCLVATEIGIQGLVVDPKTQDLVSYYKKFGFELISENAGYPMWLPAGTCFKLMMGGDL